MKKNKKDLELELKLAKQELELLRKQLSSVVLAVGEYNAQALFNFLSTPDEIKWTEEHVRLD